MFAAAFAAECAGKERKVAKKKTFGTVLKEARMRRGLTQRQLGGKLGIGGSHVAYLEGDQRRPSMPLLRKIVGQLRLDGRETLFLVYPDARALIMETRHR